MNQEVRPAEVPINVIVTGEQDGLHVEVRPWVRRVFSGQRIRWVLHSPLEAQISIEDKPDQDNLAPPVDDDDKHRGPFPFKDGQLEMYNVVLTIDDEPPLTIDPGYRVEP